MTPEQAKLLMPVFTAYANGEKCEYLSEGGEWVPSADIIFKGLAMSFRIARSLRPWRIDEVPIGSVVSKKGERSRYLLWGVDDDGHVLVGQGWASRDELLNKWAMSDGTPCGVLEETKP